MKFSAIRTIYSFGLLAFLAVAACAPLRRAPVETRRPEEAPHPTPTPEAVPEAETKSIRKSPEPKTARRSVLIGLRVEVEEVRVSCDATLNVTNMMTGEREQWAAGQYSVIQQGDTLYVNGQKRADKLKLASTSPAALLHSHGQTFRGSFIVKTAADGKVTLVNELSIDDYVKGVLPREVVVSWHEECLRVQAVASRSYLASNLSHHKSQGFDLCAGVHCQVYGGTDKENDKSSAAVDDTAGEVLSYNGKPIKAFFHSNCGGSTEEISYVWGPRDIAYLPRKKCSFGTGDPRYNWKISVKDTETLANLRKKTKVEGEKLISLAIKRKSPSGRAELVTVKTDAGTYNLTGNEFRIAMHPEKIRSTLWTRLTDEGDSYRFEGFGWGHGVGMCQWGAKGQAERGRDYKSILKFYYPNTVFDVWHGT